MKIQTNNTKKISLKLGEFFSGPGGMALGAKQAKVQKDGIGYVIEHSWANDYDSDTCNTYRKNICPNSQDSVICKDIKTLDFTKLSPIDIFAFGFPCNDFSLVGEQKGFNGDFGPLYSYGIKLINLLRPKFFVAENVGGLRSANEGQAFKKILYDLENAGQGYVLTPHLYKFEEYGVPQCRHRIIMVGVAKDLGLKFQVPVPTTADKFVTAFEAISSPPILEGSHNNELTSQSLTVVERLKHIKAGQNIWEAELPKHLQLNVKGARMSQIYKRLHPDKPAYTVTGSGGGGTHIYHWSENRALTNRERARLQTFPDNFIFEGSKESVRKQIGMAVPVKGAQVIFEALLKTFAGIPYNHISANLEIKEKKKFNQTQLEIVIKPYVRANFSVKGVQLVRN
jgi:DNA (cytosine-5)-methyltransferase 1